MWIETEGTIEKLRMTQKKLLQITLLLHCEVRSISNHCIDIILLILRLEDRGGDKAINAIILAIVQAIEPRLLVLDFVHEMFDDHRLTLLGETRAVHRQSDSKPFNL